MLSRDIDLQLVCRSLPAVDDHWHQQTTAELQTCLALPLAGWHSVTVTCDTTLTLGQGGELIERSGRAGAHWWVESASTRVHPPARPIGSGAWCGAIAATWACVRVR